MCFKEPFVVPIISKHHNAPDLDHIESRAIAVDLRQWVITIWVHVTSIARYIFRTQLVLGGDFGQHPLNPQI